MRLNNKKWFVLVKKKKKREKKEKPTGNTVKSEIKELISEKYV